KGMKLCAVIDQSAEARQAGLALRETTLVIFGSPAAGTPVMQASPLSALDLPLKVLVWDDGGQTKVSYDAPAALAARHHLSAELAGRLPGLDALADAPGASQGQPPANPPPIREGPGPAATVSGSGASGGEWDRSCSQAKNLMNARRLLVRWSRMVPRSIGYLASSASSTESRVTWPATSSSTSPSTRASVRRCAGRITRIMAASLSWQRPFHGSVPFMAASALLRTARREDRGRSVPRCLRRRPTRTPARRWCRS